MKLNVCKVCRYKGAVNCETCITALPFKARDLDDILKDLTDHFANKIIFSKKEKAFMYDFDKEKICYEYEHEKFGACTEFNQSLIIPSDLADDMLRYIKCMQFWDEDDYSDKDIIDQIKWAVNDTKDLISDEQKVKYIKRILKENGYDK